MPRPRFTRAKAMAWLQERLADGEPVEVQTLLEEARAAGIVQSIRALQRAADQLGIVRQKEHEFGGRWRWRLQERMESNQ